MGRPDICRLLLQLNADPLAKDRKCRPPPPSLPLAAFVHTMRGCVVREKATEFQFRAGSRPCLRSPPETGPHCTTLLAVATLTSAVCCCSATPTTARRPTSIYRLVIMAATLQNSVCACLCVCFAGNALHCTTALGTATLRLAVFWSSPKPMSPRGAGASARFCPLPSHHLSLTVGAAVRAGLR